MLNTLLERKLAEISYSFHPNSSTVTSSVMSTLAAVPPLDLHQSYLRLTLTARRVTIDYQAGHSSDDTANVSSDQHFPDISHGGFERRSTPMALGEPGALKTCDPQ